MEPSTLFGKIITSLTEKPENGGLVFGLGMEDRQKAKIAARKGGEYIRDLLLTARRYHLSNDITNLASTYGFNVDDPLNKMLNIAKPPFDKIWLEWSAPAQLTSLGIEPAIGCPLFTGVLIRKVPHSSSRYIISYLPYDENKFVDIHPISIMFDNNIPIEPTEAEKCHKFMHDCIYENIYITDVDGNPSDIEKSKFEMKNILSAAMLGGKMDSIYFDADTLSQIFPYATYCFTPVVGERFAKLVANNNPSYSSVLRDSIVEHLRETAGSLRFVLGALALLNTKEYVQHQPIKPGQKRPNEDIKPKLQPSYDFVTLTAPPVVIMRQIQGEESEEKRKERMRHEVSGTWVNYHKTGNAECEHVFANRDQSGDRKICLLCGLKKSWRREHERGNIALGYKQRKPRLVVH